MRKLMVVAAALLMLASGCGDDDDTVTGGDGAEQPTSAPTDVPTTDDEDSGDAVNTDTAQPESSDQQVASGDPVAVMLEIGGPVPVGRYATDLLGTALELNLDEAWIPVAGDPGAFIVEGADKVGPFSEAILVTRMSSFGAASDIANPEPAGQDLAGPPDDFDAWLAAGELVVDRDETTEVGGVPARVVDVRVDPTGAMTFPGGCGPTPDDRCFFVGGTRSEALAFYIVRTSEVYRIWNIPQEGFAEPIVIVAVAVEGNESFLDDARTLVDSITLGDSVAHPVEKVEGAAWEAGLPAMVPAGSVTLPTLGGITFEMDEERFIFQDQNFVQIDADIETDSPFGPGMQIAWIAKTGETSATTERPVDGIDDYLGLLAELGTATPIGETIDVLGATLVGYEFELGFSPLEEEPPVVFSSAPIDGASNFASFPGDFARIYVADHPSGVGVLMVGYDGFTLEEKAIAAGVFEDIIGVLEIAG
jgi:hypothetical protein